MLKHSRSFLTGACFVFVIAALSLIGTLSPSYQKCAATYERDHTRNEQTDLSKGATWRVEIPMPLICEGAFIDENSGTLTALATIAIAAFTLTLWRATTEHGRITDKVLALARDEFNATHRPRLTISFVHRIHEKPGQIAVEFRVENIGTGKGTVTGSNIVLDFFFPATLPPPDDLTGENLLKNITLDKGGGWRFTAHKAQLASTIQIEERNAKFLYLMGWIVYEDAIGPQTTYLCRKYVFILDRFSKVTDTDYER